jgi:hypothetical protein
MMGTKIIIWEIFFSISWPAQGMMYPQGCFRQILLFEILKGSDGGVFSGLLSFSTLSIVFCKSILKETEITAF